jgi:Rod binding domain-containing protein
MPPPDTLSLSAPPASASFHPHSTPVRQNASPKIAGNAHETPAARKLQKAAAEFESILLANLWKSMKGSFAASDDESADPAHDTLEDMGIQAMSSAVGKNGGLGLGKLILKHLEPLLAPANSTNALQPGKASALSADTFLETHESITA